MKSIVCQLPRSDDHQLKKEEFEIVGELPSVSCSDSVHKFVLGQNFGDWIFPDREYVGKGNHKVESCV